MKNNTVVTIGDANYLWGLFLLAASMRKSGMDEPILVGTQKFDDRCYRVLKQLGNVEFISLDHAERSLTCYKAEAMLKANTEYVTWIDSDGIFTGNCSELLPPPDDTQIHIRKRVKQDMPYAFPPEFNLHEILPQWKKDVESFSGKTGAAVPAIEDFCSCSACSMSIARKQDDFLRLWNAMMMTHLPKVNIGVVDKTLRCYHQLDESCLNACLLFAPNAPKITETYQLNKDRNRLFVHFYGRPKPWIGWIPSSVRHFDATVSIVEWAISEKLELPSAIPFSLKRSHKILCTLGARPYELWHKIKRRLKL